MKTKHDFVGSWWAEKGSYGHPLANNPGEGAPRLGGTTGAYASASTASGDPHASKGKTVKNRPGEGAGPQSNKPVGGKKGLLNRGKRKGMYLKSYSTMHMGDY